MLPRERERHFPNLAVEGYRVTSQETYLYNCHAWAAGDTSHWWQPDAWWLPYAYWPPGAIKETTLAGYTQAFAAIGYEVCATGDLEEAFEKLAIFIDEEGEPTYTARQLASGAWTSKLGEWQDIEHDSLTALEGSEYGRVARFLRRPKPGHSGQ